VKGGAGTFSDGKLTSRSKRISAEKNSYYQVMLRQELQRKLSI